MQVGVYVRKESVLSACQGPCVYTCYFRDAISFISKILNECRLRDVNHLILDSQRVSQTKFKTRSDATACWHKRLTITAKAWASTKWASEFTDLPFRYSVIQGQSEKSIHLVILLTQEFESCALPGKSLGMSLHSLPASTHHQI